uniref:Uncharacterized protein n=1 Tax=Siphoviridae sp. ct0Wl9 TaxID=2827763 RepID=A0A8S5T8V2_9CAUD|nr:MAG TPA: hypothetical protein [Siphoviridae sp. ct0Wl9]
MCEENVVVPNVLLSVSASTLVILLLLLKNTLSPFM